MTKFRQELTFYGMCFLFGNWVGQLLINHNASYLYKYEIKPECLIQSITTK